MALYRIHRMKEVPRQQFRWAPHSSGATIVRAKDFEPGDAVESSSAYALWQSLRLTTGALNLGDLLEAPDGRLIIFKYVGFEEAQWAIPETKPIPILVERNLSETSAAIG